MNVSRDRTAWISARILSRIVIGLALVLTVGCGGEETLAPEQRVAEVEQRVEVEDPGDVRVAALLNEVDLSPRSR